MRETVDARARARERVRADDRAGDAARPQGRGAATTPAPDPDLQADMFELACELLGDAGYEHYEVSNWAKPGFECRHNLGYWERRPYLGLGAGAHSYRDGRRWWNVRPPEEYLARVEARRAARSAATSGSNPPTPTSRRCSSASGSSRASRRAGSSPRSRRAVPRERAARSRATRLIPTERGMLLLNELVLALAATRTVLVQIPGSGTG